MRRTVFDADRSDGIFEQAVGRVIVRVELVGDVALSQVSFALFFLPVDLIMPRLPSWKVIRAASWYFSESHLYLLSHGLNQAT
jgi:hypothetical protein